MCNRYTFIDHYCSTLCVLEFGHVRIGILEYIGICCCIITMYNIYIYIYMFACYNAEYEGSHSAMCIYIYMYAIFIYCLLPLCSKLNCFSGKTRTLSASAGRASPTCRCFTWHRRVRGCALNKDLDLMGFYPKHGGGGGSGDWESWGVEGLLPAKWGGGDWEFGVFAKFTKRKSKGFAEKAPRFFFLHRGGTMLTFTSATKGPPLQGSYLGGGSERVRAGPNVS